MSQSISARREDGALITGFDVLRDLVGPLKKVDPPPRDETKGFFTDTTLCIGCKACEVACKQWNQLPAETKPWAGNSHDNTGELSSTTWRHVLFVEQLAEDRAAPRWLLMSDVCKHCANAPCQEVCPTGAIVRTEFDTVYVQQDICNGCGYCVAACPFGVISRNPIDGGAHKCTMCYDRLKGGEQPACAKVCPTQSIQFGNLGELKLRAENRLEELRARGQTDAYLYGHDDRILEGGLHAFFLLEDRPEVYNLPARPRRPTKSAGRGYVATLAMAAGLVLAGALTFAGRSKSG